MSAYSLPPANTRIGFHYFEDTTHYREADLTTWLPEMEKFNTSWVILTAPVNRAVPETFIRGLVEHRMEPVLHISPKLSVVPPLDDLRLLFDQYGKWGVHYVILYDRPNIKSSWPAAAWSQGDLVERFLDRFIPLANLAVEHGLLPVFPPLQPGGDYWDTSFLKAALESLQRRKQTTLLDNLLLTAVAEFSSKGLKWGAGGPERWPGAKPYQNSARDEDQLGFYIFDWYNAVSRAVINRDIPILLVNAGSVTGSAARQKEYIPVFQLLNGEDVNLPGTVENKLPMVPENVLACVFHLVPGSDDRSLQKAFFGFAQEAAEHEKSILRWMVSRKSVDAPRVDPETKPGHPLKHYLLLPFYEWGVSEWHLEVIRPFVKKYQPTIGFSVTEAALAVRVTVVGGPQAFPDEVLQPLLDAGCQLDRITGDGTTIASQLAER
jgi:hypothetical protein